MKEKMHPIFPGRSEEWKEWMQERQEGEQARSGLKDENVEGGVVDNFISFRVNQSAPSKTLPKALFVVAQRSVNVV